MQVRAHRLDELELLLTLLSLLAAFLAPRFSQPAFRSIVRHLRRMAARPRLSLGLVAVLPLLLRAALLPWMPVPQPQIQEEFSYLLAADTFAHGRLANPAHPMAVFFDNIQIIQTPHYASARLPGQAVFLAFGEVVFHLPWAGVLLSVALMCAAFHWMLRAWTPPVWALLASLLFAIRFGVFTYWMNSYWGGSIIALGGALILGALPRLLRRQRLKDAMLYALGCCLLASSRPYEGVFFILPTAILLGARWRRSPAVLRRRFLAAFAVVACAVAAYIAWFGYYNFATTGSPFETAYGLWRKQQSIVPAFWWQALRRVPPVYYSRQTCQFNAIWEVQIYRTLHRSLFAGISNMAWRLVQFLQLYLRPLLLLPLLVGAARAESWREGGRSKAAALRNGLWIASGLLAILLGHAVVITAIFLIWGIVRILPRSFIPGNSPSRRARWGREVPVVLLLAGAVSAALTNFSMPTYYAHFTAPAFVLVAAGLGSLASWRRRQGAGPALVLNLSLCCCFMFLVSAAFTVLRVHVVHESPFNWSTYENRLEDRAAAQKFLERQPGRQLAIVRYGPHHDVLDEWVWNLADVDRQKVVWARELKPSWTTQLVRYYAGRKVWLVEPDAGRILPYPVSSLPAPGEPLPPLTYVK